jgi:putative cell wall-binding protein
VIAELERRGKVVERVAGADRERTAIALADLLLSYGQALVEVEVAAASSFADALALGPHAAPASPVLLCRSAATCGPETLAWIAARSDAVDRIVIAGGTGAIGPAAEAELVLAAA